MNHNYKLNKSKPVILLIESDLDHADLLIRSFESFNSNISFVLLTGMEEAFSFLLKEGKYTEVMSPDLIMLDLSISDGNGYALLREIKNSKHLKAFPVITFSTSEEKADIANAYDLFANSYIIKSREPKEIKQMTEIIARFWLTIVKLPEPNN